MWYANAVQAGGVLTMPNDGRPEHQPPYTPSGLQLYKTHKPLEGYDAVGPGEENDPRELCDPLGVPHVNHYQNRQTQIFQDDETEAGRGKKDAQFHFRNRFGHRNGLGLFRALSQ
jgi:hypothetical protein